MLGLGVGTLVGGAGPAPIAPSLYSATFDGAGDWIDFTETTFPTGLTGDDISISFWCKRASNSNEAVILGNSATRWWNYIYFDIDGDMLFIESELNGEYAYADVSQNTAWHHYVITALGVGSGSGGESVVKFYEDGSDITSTGDTINFANASYADDFTLNRIGSNEGGGDGGSSAQDGEFHGLIYQLAIWDAILDADAVAAIYNGTPGTAGTGSPISLQDEKAGYVNSRDLLHLWNFSEGEGATTADSIGSLTGTFAGNATFSTALPTDV